MYIFWRFLLPSTRGSARIRTKVGHLEERERVHRLALAPSVQKRETSTWFSEPYVLHVAASYRTSWAMNCDAVSLFCQMAHFGSNPCTAPMYEDGTGMSKTLLAPVPKRRARPSL